MSKLCFVVVQSLSHVQFCNSMDCSMTGLCLGSILCVDIQLFQDHLFKSQLFFFFFKLATHFYLVCETGVLWKWALRALAWSLRSSDNVHLLFSFIHLPAKSDVIFHLLKRTWQFLHSQHRRGSALCVHVTKTERLLQRELCGARHSSWRASILALKIENS